MTRGSQRILCLNACIFLLAIAAPSTAYEQQIGQLSATLIVEIVGAGKKTIAVVDFTDLQGNVTELGRFLAEEFSVAMAGAGKGFEVVDRTHLGSILREHKLSTTGLIDPQTARQLGKIVGVEALITATITPFGDSVRIAIKVLDTESAKIIGSTTGNIPRTGAVEDLLGRGIGSRAPLLSPGGTIPAAVASQQTVESNEFEFALQECRRSGERLVCSMLVINKGEDRKLYIYGESRLFDEFGNEHKIYTLQFGDSKHDLRGVSYIDKILIRGVPTRVEAIFSGVSGQATRVAVLEIKCRFEREKFNVQLRNIKIAG